MKKHTRKGSEIRHKERQWKNPLRFQPSPSRKPAFARSGGHLPHGCAHCVNGCAHGRAHHCAHGCAPGTIGLADVARVCAQYQLRMTVADLRTVWR